MSEIVIKEFNNQLVVNTRQVARDFNKNHKDVLRDVRNLMAQNCAVRNFFYETTYINERGREYPEFLMNRDGFTLLVMGFTGKEAIEWKLKYIEAFNHMEKALQESRQISNKEKLLLQLFDDNPAVVAQAHKQLVKIEVEEATKPLLETIEEQTPKVHFAEQIIESDTSIDMAEMANILTKRGYKIGRNKLFQKLRDMGILKRNNLPYQRYMDSGYFEVTQVVTHVGARTKTVITPKGQMYLINKLVPSQYQELLED